MVPTCRDVELEPAPRREACPSQQHFPSEGSAVSRNNSPQRLPSENWNRFNSPQCECARKLREPRRPRRWVQKC
jgi:hypothetical protein